ncbi:MAG: hypothetical protein IJD71_01945, partial [Clostridia bacterium]|nr:hypothetical protein [Clostridia bacterium]
MKKTIALVLSLLIAVLSLNACGYFIPFCDDFIPSTSLASADTTSLSSKKSPEGVSSKNSSKQNKPSSSKKQSSTSKPNNKGENYIKAETANTSLIWARISITETRESGSLSS